MFFLFYITTTFIHSLHNAKIHSVCMLKKVQGKVNIIKKTWGNPIKGKYRLNFLDGIQYFNLYHKNTVVLSKLK